LIEEEEAKNYSIIINWDNISKIKEKENIFSLPFSIWHFKKGLIISWFDVTLLDILRKPNRRDIKQWKVPNLKMTMQVEYRKYTPSLQEVFDWSDCKKASQFLKEHNLIEMP
jgi:hypothetical protein